MRTAFQRAKNIKIMNTQGAPKGTIRQRTSTDRYERRDCARGAAVNILPIGTPAIVFRDSRHSLFGCLCNLCVHGKDTVAEFREYHEESDEIMWTYNNAILFSLSITLLESAIRIAPKKYCLRKSQSVLLLLRE